MNDNDVCAIFDIGSNSVRMNVFGMSGDGGFSLLRKETRKCALGKGMTVERGTLSALAEDRVQAALEVLGSYADLLVRHVPPVTRVHAVATAAVRDASNQAEFLQRVRQTTTRASHPLLRDGLAVEVATQEREATLTARGVILGLGDVTGVVADLGGRSLELVYVEQGRIREWVSLNLGVHVLMNMGLADVRGYILDALAPVAWLAARAPDTLYLVGGNWRAMGRYAKYIETQARAKTVQGYTPELRPFMALCAWLIEGNHLGDSADAAIARDIMGAERKDEMPYSALLLKELMLHLGTLLAPRFAKVVVSEYGVREGLLAEVMSRRRKIPDQCR